MWSVPWDRTTSNPTGVSQSTDKNGSIGIPEIELLAQKAQLRTIRSGFFRERLNVADGWSGLLDEGEMIELGTRSLVRVGFKAALAGKLGASLLDRLEKVFFEMAYPTPNWPDLD